MPATPPPPGRPRLPPTVLALGVVSLLADVSSEMVYPLLPVLLAGTLGAGAAALGAVEGAAESTAALLKLYGGRWSDRAGRRMPFVIAGYAVAALARPLVALATAWPHVLAVRIADRTGKGIRTAPRDALLAAAAEPGDRGRAFGFHRAMDHAGAAVGPLLAFALLGTAGLSLPAVFALSAVPGLLAVAVLVAAVREPSALPRPAPPAGRPDGPVPPPLRRFLVLAGVFALGNSSDAFLLLRAHDLGVPAAQVPLLWAAFHGVKALTSTHGGALSDRLGRRRVIRWGWVVYALVYAGFAAAREPWHAWALLGVYALHHALTEGTEKALVADLVPEGSRGTGFGWYHLVLGAAALPASLLFGAAWERSGAATAFLIGAALAGIAAAALPWALPAASPPPCTSTGESPPAR